MPIRVLDEHLINKIAAGEVVERPSSVVKELVENSIDAGATQIIVEIKDGGLNFIRITDNGCGIEKSDVKNAFLPHATSKIASTEDLFRINTLGFRGEALASISAISNVEMITKTASDPTGIRIELSGGVVKSESEVGSAEGTTIIIRNLFYNTPARRKFLKKESVEGGYVSDLITRIALCNPKVSFKYIVNESSAMQTTGNGDLKSAILCTYGREIAKNLIPIQFEEEDFSLNGYLSKPEICRSNRSYQNLFINGRFVKNEMVAKAVEEAYKTLLPLFRFPVFVLQLKLNPTEVDVNVHPSKLEVRFSNEKEIFDKIQTACARAFVNQDLVPELSLSKMGIFNKLTAPLFGSQKDVSYQKEVDETGSATMASTFQENMSRLSEGQEKRSVGSIFDQLSKQDLSDQEVRQQGVSKQEVSRQEVNDQDVSYQKESKSQSSTHEVNPEISEKNVKTQLSYLFGDSIKSSGEALDPDAESQRDAKAFPLVDYKILGQLFVTYWLIQCGDKLYIVDQHAAHERILYDSLVKQFSEKTVYKQKLIEPIILKLTELETFTLEDNLTLIRNFGFDIEKLAGKYCITSVPFLLKRASGIDYFIEILDKLSTYDNVYETKLNEIASIACKEAIKANDRLTSMEARQLVQKLCIMENPFTCPHGRPTVVELSKYELEKKFERV